MIFIFSFNVSANPPEAAPKKWPCDQVYNPKLNLSAIWQGPPIDNALKNWWKDDDIIDYVNTLSNPVLKEEDGLSKQAYQFSTGQQGSLDLECQRI